MSRQQVIAKKIERIVTSAFEEGERFADPVEQRWFLGGIATAILLGGHTYAARATGTSAADEWLGEQLRGFSGMLGDGPPRRRVRITIEIEEDTKPPA